MVNEESKSDAVKEARLLLEGITPWPWRLASFGDRPEIEGDFPSGDRKYPCRQILTMGFPHVEWSTFDPIVQQEFKRDAALIVRTPELLSALCDEVERLQGERDGLDAAVTVQAESIIEFQSQLRVMKEAIEAARDWISVQAETWTCQHADEPMRCSRCSLRQKAKQLTAQLRSAITPKGSEPE